MGQSLRETCELYIGKCRAVLKAKDTDAARKLRLEATKVFHGSIPGWEAGLMASITHFYLDDIESILGKLIRFRTQLDMGYDPVFISMNTDDLQKAYRWDIRQQRKVLINSFESTCLWILENYAANSREMTDILDKIHQLQDIANETADRGERWEQLKGFLDWIQSKNADLAARLLPLVADAISPLS